MPFVKTSLRESCLDVTDLVGNVKGIVVGGESDESLLLTVGSDEGVDRGNLDLVELLDGISDLVLVGLLVDNEDEGVGVLDLLHGSLGVKGRDDDIVGVHSGVVSNGLSLVLGLLGELKDLGSSEDGGGSVLEGLGAVGTLEGSLLGVLSLSGGHC